MEGKKIVYDLSGNDTGGKPFTEVKVDVPKPDSSIPAKGGEEPTPEPAPEPAKPAAEPGKGIEDGPSPEPKNTDDANPKGQDEPDQGDSKDKKPNVYSTLGKFLKGDGLLPEDIEIPEDADANFVRSAIRQAVASPIEEQTREEVTQRVISELESQGINDHHLNLALLAASGKQAFLTEADRVRKYSEYKLDDLAESDDYEEVVVEVVRSMYADRGLKPTEVDRIIKAAQSDDELDKIFEEEAVPYHKEKYSSIVAEARKQKDEELRIARAKEKYVQDTVSKVFSQRTIRDAEISDQVAAELQADLFQASEQLDYGNGQVFKVTPFQRFLAEFQNDFEFQLYVFNKYKFGGTDVEKVREQVKEELEEELLLGLQTTADLKGDTGSQVKVQDDWQNKVKKGQIFSF